MFGGPAFHMDVSDVVPANEFGGSVTSTLQASELGGGFVYSTSSFADNFLHSSRITALFGTLSGADGLGWTADAHPVVVWVGSTAPREPSYRRTTA